MKWLSAVCLLVAALGAAVQAPASEPAEAPATPVTVTVATSADLEVWETSVGQLEAKVAPLIAAEVSGRLTGVHVEIGDRIEPGQPLADIDDEDFRLAAKMADADITRLRALIKAQHLKVKRLRSLVRKQSVDQSALDDAEAQLDALRAELAAARVKLQQAQRDIGRTRITSPVGGRVDEIRVSEGDYVSRGAPLLRITNTKRLKARLPYPETLLSQLRAGLPVRLESPSVPDVTVEARVTQVRPSITVGSRSAQVIVIVDNPGAWEPGASVTGAVRIDVHEGVVLLPEVAVVDRPAGQVVYVVDGDKAKQRVVRTGLRRDGRVEILTGIKAGERLVADGAGFLTDGARVSVKAP